MEFLEKDLEDIIFSSDKEKLSEKGLYLFGKIKRQLRIGNYGVADLVELKRPYYHSGFKRMQKGEINIIELKKDNISASAFYQALNYMKGINRYLELHKPSQLHNYNFKITLIGKSVDTNSSIVYLGDMFQNDFIETDTEEENRFAVNLITYSYGLDGLSFKEVSDYQLINEGF